MLLRLSPPKFAPLSLCVLLASLLAAGNTGCFIGQKPVVNPLAASKSAQPDKALYDVAMQDMGKGKFVVARLNLETLLNTYPDSEYLAQAKMAIANSWYEEGGADGMAQAEAQYKDFITFFPAMKEAAQAQLRVAQIHFAQIQKPDRDPTEANRSEQELRTFLVNYPDSSLRPQALEMLRQTQEVLADREYRIGQFYLQRAQGGDFPDYRAAQSRLEEMLVKYPLYSQGDAALDQLANSYLTTAKLYHGGVPFQPTKPLQELFTANHDADQANATADFQRLIARYPLSPYVKDARAKLTGLHIAIPDPTAEEIAFNREEINGRTTGQNQTRGFTGDLRHDLNSVWSGKPATEFLRADRVGNPPINDIPWTPDPTVPGLDNLLKETMVATGAVAPGTSNAAIIQALTGGKSNPTLAGNTATQEANNQVQAATPAPDAKKPLAFEDVPDKDQGAGTLQSNTPQATTGTNENDPNAVAAAAPPPSNILLTPNDIDLENREQMLASEVHREIPENAAQLAKDQKKQQQAAAKLIAELKKHPPAANTTAATTPAISADPGEKPPTVQKKSWLSRIWP